MKIEKTICDKCGKEAVNEDPLSTALRNLNNGTVYDFCPTCWEEFHQVFLNHKQRHIINKPNPKKDGKK